MIARLRYSLAIIPGGVSVGGVYPPTPSISTESGFIIVDDGWDADASAFEEDSCPIVNVGRNGFSQLLARLAWYIFTRVVHVYRVPHLGYFVVMLAAIASPCCAPAKSSRQVLLAEFDIRELT